MNKKLVLIFSALLLSGCLLNDISFIGKVLEQDKYDTQSILAKDEIDDVSKLNKTKIFEIFKAANSINSAENALVETVKKAKKEKLKISIAGKRHSMGGQSIYPGGIAIDMLSFNQMSVDKEKKILHVQSGALWSDIIPFLDQYGLAIKVMQSDSDFSVGGSISVNCHGWQNDSEPIASTVESFRMILSDGNIVKCSKTENTELFSLVLGGYGLFGIILDVDINVVPNERYTYNKILIPSKHYISTYKEYINKYKDIRMSYGRISVAPDSFMSEAIFHYMRHEPASDGSIPKFIKNDKINYLARGIFRGSAENDYGKNLRWKAEKEWQPLLDSRYYSRNQLMVSNVKTYANNSSTSTDILHEYFIPEENFNTFLDILRATVKDSKANLLNITIRNIDKDNISFLHYANKDVFSLVLSFNYKTTIEEDKKMEVITQKLIDQALKLGGNYYLPYRLHATKEQFYKAYPQADEFFKLKKKYDPDMIFQNKLFTKYFTD